MSERLSGILNVNKPSGITSRRVVDRVARIVWPAKAGHAGTLDPLASGVLAVAVGKATRMIGQIQQQRKEYRAGFELGRRSDTDDVMGNIVEVEGAQPVTREQVESELPRFLGRIEQAPPSVSAVHVGGERAYNLARKGEKVEIEPRMVEINEIRLTAFSYPRMELEIVCGSGTYVRAIGRDLGARLGCGAVMESLVRTRVGPYRLEHAISPDHLDSESLVQAMASSLTAVQHLRQYQCSSDDLALIGNGRRIAVPDSLWFDASEMVAVIGPDGGLACLAEFDEQTRQLAPRHVLL